MPLSRGRSRRIANAGGRQDSCLWQLRAEDQAAVRPGQIDQAENLVSDAKCFHLDPKPEAHHYEGA